jgi:hypothetical protein
MTTRAPARRSRVGARALVLVFATACGDVYIDPIRPSVDTTPDAMDSNTTGGTSDREILCPSNRPRENTACSFIGSSCEYGESADLQCNTILVCRGFDDVADWEPRPADPCYASTCPASTDVASLEGQPCTIASDAGLVNDADEAVCNVSDGVCACTTGRDGTTAHERKWVCIRPISVCPPNRPLAGQPCVGSLWCDYGSCAFKRGLAMECRDSVWRTGGEPCE